ncbi:hypothetical protein FB554_2552 [Barrientosiimonas humi]|uniref:Uncharacterized protein n=1 Tax=Barrientosiimonas humi TaxID=999931 RepID=A0A542XEX6_9MICO|nr:hypothetical protein [Barrientosiimonas humi]TQL34383.1 hypothetical protein FB554_2552 [Barrientosiimonas humi]CAG7574373.1 hypothetical protein BH39T_PBIAJDOK_03023 [Barrientosiimonas humi]
MTNLPTTSTPTLYVGRCTTCGWETEPLRYVAAGDLTEAHSGTCPEASTEVWPADSTGLSDSDGRREPGLPRFVCPAWCTTPHEQHASELAGMEGQLVHHGAVDKDQPTEVWLCEATWPAGEPTGDQPTLTVAGSCQELTVDEARALAKALLRAANALQARTQPEVAR